MASPRRRRRQQSQNPKPIGPLRPLPPPSSKKTEALYVLRIGLLQGQRAAARGGGVGQCRHLRGDRPAAERGRDCFCQDRADAGRREGGNQAVCGGKLAYPTYFVGHVGRDAHGKLITEALQGGGVVLDRLTAVAGAPTGHAVAMLQSNGQNSIIIVGGANMVGWPESLPPEDLAVVKNAGILLLQREIPEDINIQVAKAGRSSGVPVILDAGGVDSPIPPELIEFIDILSPNETELARLTNMPTESFEQISQAAEKCHKMGVKQVLVKLGAKGSVLFIEGEEPIRQSIISASKVVDTTGAGDTFTAAFAVALVEGNPKKDCLKFAAAAASLCVQVKGAIPSMPDRKSVSSLLQMH